MANDKLDYLDVVNGSRPKRLWPAPALLLGALTLLPLLFLAYEIAFTPAVPFIWNSADAAWIGQPSQFDAKVRLAGEGLTSNFSKEFDVSSNIPERVVFRFKALGSLKLFVNGAAVPDEATRVHNWKRETAVDITHSIQPGRNRLLASVHNPRGPCLLWAQVEGLFPRISTDSDWTAQSANGVSASAVPANDVLTHPDAGRPASTWALATQHKLPLVGFAGAGMLAAFLISRPRRAVPPISSARSLVWAITAFWLFVFFQKMVRIDARIGFDALAHLNYISFILQEHSFPMAGDGWAMYHPPLFYLLSAAAVGGLKASSGGPEFFKFAAGLVPFISGLGTVWLTWLLSRRLFENDTLKASAAVLVGGLWPMGLYMSAYVSNETLCGLLAHLVMLLTVIGLGQSRVTPWMMLALGCAGGLALLSKFTGVIPVFLAVLFLGAKLVTVERVSLKRAASLVTVVVLGLAVISGWFYVRNFLHYGRFLVFNWNLPTGSIPPWWQQPGFHMPGYLLSFGSCLAQPYFSGFRSFWDALYSTFWLDGLVGGRVVLEGRHQLWNYDFMSLVSPLALLPTAVIGLGFFRSLWHSLFHPDAGLRLSYGFLCGLSLLMGFAMIHYSLAVPIYSTTKAFFALSLLGPMAVFFAEGLQTGLEFLRPVWLRYGLSAWLGMLAGSIILSFAT